MPSALTQEQLAKTLQSFKGEFREGLATKKDLTSLEARMATKQDLLELEGRVKQDVGDLEERMTSKFSDLQMSVDRYLKFTETWHSAPLWSN